MRLICLRKVSSPGHFAVMMLAAACSLLPCAAESSPPDPDVRTERRLAGVLYTERFEVAPDELVIVEDDLEVRSQEDIAIDGPILAQRNAKSSSRHGVSIRLSTAGTIFVNAVIQPSSGVVGAKSCEAGGRGGDLILTARKIVFRTPELRAGDGAKGGAGAPGGSGGHIILVTDHEPISILPTGQRAQLHGGRGGVGGDGTWLLCGKSLKAGQGGTGGSGGNAMMILDPSPASITAACTDGVPGQNGVDVVGADGADGGPGVNGTIAHVNGGDGGDGGPGGNATGGPGGPGGAGGACCNPAGPGGKGGVGGKGGKAQGGKGGSGGKGGDSYFAVTWWGSGGKGGKGGDGGAATSGNGGAGGAGGKGNPGGTGGAGGQPGVATAGAAGLGGAGGTPSGASGAAGSGGTVTNGTPGAPGASGGACSCSAVANCGTGFVSCSGTSNCLAVDRDCSTGQRGSVTCDGVTTACPATCSCGSSVCCQCDSAGDCFSCCRCSGGSGPLCIQACS